MADDERGWHQGRALKQLIGTKQGAERDVAGMLGVSPQTVRLWKKQPELQQRNVDKIVAVFGITEKWFTTGRLPKYNTSGGKSAIQHRIDTALVMYEKTIVRQAKTFALEIARIASET